ncbi:hypothetical protein NP493_317g02058 [Ridgeia piscesae]|uniref:DUF4062 domain-containing protein n=1 Tax=Ridgeia piscesae TaxID=27915 RepID=A0AAD9L4X9_RIDPI|nr:hypothetical protein NP493_317g02058 [Ridgeia piscesae]
MSMDRHRAMGPGAFERVLRGALDKLPPEKSNVVRVFLSSGFTDFQHERNVLASEAVPQLRTYCHTKGLDLQVVDLQWGAHPEDVTEPGARDTSRGEIRKCCQSSLGSCLVYLIGDKYGDSPIVTSIEAEEFELLRQTALVVSKDVTLLDTWYARDENAVPAAYVLQPVESKFPYYNAWKEEKRAKREQDRKDWFAVRNLLQITLRAAASHALKCGLINKTQSQRYFQSALETDVTAGLEVHSNTHRCLCFKRKITNIDISDKLAGDYVDLDCGQPDLDANDQLRTLVDTTIPATLSKSNILQYTIDWQPGGLDPVNCGQHEQYLRSLTETFVRCVRTHVKRLLRSSAIPDCHLRDELYHDILHHAHVCNKMTQLFFGREKLLTEIKSKLQKVYHEDVALVHENKTPLPEDEQVKKENKDSAQEDVKTKRESKYLVLQDGKFRREKVDSETERREGQQRKQRFGSGKWCVQK